MRLPGRRASERVLPVSPPSVLLLGRHGSKSISSAMLCTYCGIRVGLSPENRVNIVTTSSSSQQDFQQTRFSIGRNFSLTPRHRCPSVCLAEFSRLYFRRIPSSQPRPAPPPRHPRPRPSSGGRRTRATSQVSFSRMITANRGRNWSSRRIPTSSRGQTDEHDWTEREGGDDEWLNPGTKG